MIGTVTIPRDLLSKLEGCLPRGYNGRITLHVQEGSIRKVETTEFTVVK